MIKIVVPSDKGRTTIDDAIQRAARQPLTVGSTVRRRP